MGVVMRKMYTYTDTLGQPIIQNEKCTVDSDSPYVCTRASPTIPRVEEPVAKTLSRTGKPVVSQKFASSHYIFHCPWISRIKQKFKNKIIKKFKMVITEH
jgi:hypothetical protein